MVANAIHDQDQDEDLCVWRYDRAGNRASRENLTKTDGSLDESYAYDGLDRLTQWDVNSVTQQTWSLDGLGNDLSAGTYSPANEETPTSLSSGYDAAGNMTTLTTGDTAVYDAWNRMTEVDDASGIVQKNTYDGTNRRIQVYTDFTGTTPDKVADDYLAGQQVIETDLTVGGIRDGAYQNLWSPRYIDAPILRDTLTTSGTGIVTADRLFYLGDANYNVTGLMKYNSTSGQWEAVERYTYKPYGAVTVRDAVWVSITGNVSQFTNATLYTGRVLEPATGLMYYRARYYDTALERFAGRDPIGAGPNFYSYCANDPICRVDPTGEVDIQGWELYGLDKEAIKQWIKDHTDRLEKAQILATGKATVNITFTEETDPDKLKWFAGMLFDSLKSAGANLAAEHFQHWLDGTGTPKPIPAEVFKGTKSYKNLMEELKKVCEAGGDKSGTKAATEFNNDKNLHVLLGDYTYQWKVEKKDSKGCCKVHFKVDDDYDFHFGKVAHFTSVKTVPEPWTGRQIQVTANVEVPDSVLVNLQKALKAKDFKRITEWDDVVPGSTTAPATPPSGGSR